MANFHDRSLYPRKSVPGFFYWIRDWVRPRLSLEAGKIKSFHSSGNKMYSYGVHISAAAASERCCFDVIPESLNCERNQEG